MYDPMPACSSQPNLKDLDKAAKFSLKHPSPHIKHSFRDPLLDESVTP